MRLRRGPRTLRGRVSLLAVAVIAAWLVRAHPRRSTCTSSGGCTRSPTPRCVYARRPRRRRSRSTRPARCMFASRAPTATSTTTPGSTPAGRRSNGRAHRATRCSSFADSLATHGAGFANLEDDARLYVLPVTVSGKHGRNRRRRAEHGGRAPAERAALAGSVIVSALLLAVAYPVVRVAVRRALEPMDAMARQAAEWSARETSRGVSAADQRYEELQCAGRRPGRPARPVVGRAAPRAPAVRRAVARVAHPARAHCRRGGSPCRAKDIRATGTRIWRSRRRRARWTGSSTPCSLLPAPSWTRRREPVGSPRSSTGSARASCARRGPVVGRRGRAVLERILAPLLDNARRYARSAVRVDVDA